MGQAQGAWQFQISVSDYSLSLVLSSHFPFFIIFPLHLKIGLIHCLPCYCSGSVILGWFFFFFPNSPSVASVSKKCREKTYSVTSNFCDIRGEKQI